MTPEDMERAFDFILKQQAEFATRQAEFDARMDREHQENLEEHRRIRAELDVTRRLFSDAILTMTDALGRLGDAQAKTELRLAHLSDRVDAFIAFVERYIEESRNGGNRN